MSSITNSNVSTTFDEVPITITAAGSGSGGGGRGGSRSGNGSIIQVIGDSIVALDSPKKRITKKMLDPMFGDTFRSLKRLNTRHGLTVCYVIRMSITQKQ